MDQRDKENNRLKLYAQIIGAYAKINSTSSNCIFYSNSQSKLHSWKSRFIKYFVNWSLHNKNGRDDLRE